MKIDKPKFWSKKGILAFFLLPITFFVIIIIFVKKKLVKPRSFKIPIICIGNIYVGGTGKTPLSIFISNELIKKNKKTVILKKYYKNQIDENELIKNNFKNFISDKNRLSGINKAVDLGYDSIVLDDGFQDYKIKKNLNILCFNQNQLIGNGFVFPAGPLRESFSALKKADIVIINGLKDNTFENKILSINTNVEIFYSQYVAQNIEELKGKRLIAIAGIGSPENFFNLLIDNNLNLFQKLPYPDHYNFKKSELNEIIDNANRNNCEVVMTEKDFYRVKSFNINKIKYVKVSLKIEKKDKLIKKVLSVYDKNI